MIPKTQQLEILKQTREMLSWIIQEYLKTDSDSSWYKKDCIVAGYIQNLIDNMEKECSDTREKEVKENENI